MYKVNITAFVEDVNDAIVESKPLHEKIILSSINDQNPKLSIFRDEEKERRSSIISSSPFPLSRQVSSIPEGYEH